METYPIKTLTIEQATKLQFKLVDCITREFSGVDFLNLGDLGVVQPMNQPLKTGRVEKILANFFGTESALLIRGAGTGALRYSLYSCLKENKKIIVHAAPVYPTSKITLDMIGAETEVVDFNDIEAFKTCIKNTTAATILIQYTRQKPDDSYDYNQIINLIKEYSDLTIITDDNYAALKVEELGAKLAKGVSTFSSFKLQGPEGIGVIVGSKNIIDDIRKMNYSGGSQVQGFEAIECLKGLIYAPVLLAIQSNVVDESTSLINQIDSNVIDHAFVANAQSKVIIVTLKKPLAKEILKECEKLGAAANPVGAESKYEIVPMFYKVSGTFLKNDPSAIDYMIRINPMRAGSETVIRILEEGINNVLTKND